MDAQNFYKVVCDEAKTADDVSSTTFGEVVKQNKVCGVTKTAEDVSSTEVAKAIQQDNCTKHADIDSQNSQRCKKRTFSQSSCSDTPAHTKALINFMRQLHLEHYTTEMLKQGYDDFDFLSSKSKEELMRVATLVKMLPGHADKFVANACFASKQKTTDRASVGQPSATSAGAKTESSYIVCIVDRSGSMASMGDAVKTGFNEFLQEQKDFPGDCMATVVRFDTKVEVVHHGVDINDVKDATDETFKPRGRTALHDAIGNTISKVKRKISTLASKPTRVMVLVLTDGEENASTKHTRAKVVKAIRRCEKKRNWTFVYVGANQDAIAKGREIGFTARNCMDYSAETHFQRAAWHNVSMNIQRQRAGGSAAWTENERLTSVHKIAY